MSSERLLSSKGLLKSYGGIAVLKAVEIDVRRGEIHAVIGPNGAGKTTLFKVLSGEIPTDSGSICFAGDRVERMDGWRRAHLGIGRTFQVARVFGEMTVFENMLIALEARRKGAAESADALFRIQPQNEIFNEASCELGTIGLLPLKDSVAGTLAYGDRKRLELAMCLALRPQLLLLDEPMAGMSAPDRSAAADLIHSLTRHRKISVLFTEHDLQIVFGLADRITVLDYGEVIASGTPEEIRASSRVRDVYLGHGTTHA